MSAIIAAAAKLVLVTAAGVAVTDYPSMERCVAARDAAIASWKAEAERNAPSGYHVVLPPTFRAICIPG